MHDVRQLALHRWGSASRCRTVTRPSSSNVGRQPAPGEAVVAGIPTPQRGGEERASLETPDRRHRTRNGVHAGCERRGIERALLARYGTWRPVERSTHRGMRPPSTCSSRQRARRQKVDSPCRDDLNVDARTVGVNAHVGVAREGSPEPPSAAQRTAGWAGGTCARSCPARGTYASRRSRAARRRPVVDEEVEAHAVGRGHARHPLAAQASDRVLYTNSKTIFR